MITFTVTQVIIIIAVTTLMVAVGYMAFFSYEKKKWGLPRQVLTDSLFFSISIAILCNIVLIVITTMKELFTMTGGLTFFLGVMIFHDLTFYETCKKDRKNQIDNAEKLQGKIL